MPITAITVTLAVGHAVGCVFWHAPILASRLPEGRRHLYGSPMPAPIRQKTCSNNPGRTSTA